MNLIDKDALVAMIDKRQRMLDLDSPLGSGGMVELQVLKDKLDTLEVQELPIWEKVSPDTGQTTLYKDGVESYLERFGYRIDLKDLDKLPKKNLKARKGE